MANIPVHLAIILDGNGRWAKKKGLPRNAGHAAGARVLHSPPRTGTDLPVKSKLS